MKIYVFCNTLPNRDQWYTMLAIAEDGHCVASHVCSHPAFGPGDMVITSDAKHDKYAAHCPDGYELEWIEPDQVKGHAGLAEAYRKNQTLAK